jgi:hypothetical protein
MGAGASKANASISEPFPVSPALARDLDKLSMVAARILSTPDIYDVENLGKAGTCGEYMVLLKKGLEKKLLPFVAKTKTGTIQEVVYQNPRKAIDNLEDRKAICSSLVDTMLRTITIVVACLASIQVASTSRELITTTQRGGGMSDVRDWLILNGYLQSSAATAAMGNRLELTVDPTLRAKGTTMQLTFKGMLGNVTEGYLNAVAPGTPTNPPMPSGSIKVQFTNPLPIPGTAKTMLPLRIVDEAGQPWLAGALYDNIFKSFYAPTEYGNFTAILEVLFRRTQGWTTTLLERRDDTKQANEVFQSYRRTGTASSIFSTLNDWLQRHVSGYTPGGAPPPAYPGYAPPAYPGAYPGYAPPPPAVTPIAPRPLGLPAAVPSAIMPGAAPTGTQQFDIPTTSSRIIMDSFKVFRDLLPRQSSPAHVRAYTLAGRLNPNRTVDTAVCQDPYWRESTLAKVYPWATLQFLCIKDWSKIAPGNDANFESDWPSFIDKLASIYSGVPGLRLEKRNNLLEQISVKGYDKLSICGQPQAFGPIQEGIATLQTNYAAHVPKVWALLNELIVVIQVEDNSGAKRDVVRLHPRIVTGTVRTTSEYVSEKATQARTLLTAFYQSIEQEYVNTINKLAKVDTPSQRM